MKDGKVIEACEFFSGIGAFAQAAAEAGIQIRAAFDQNAAVNSVYAANYGVAPCARNLDSICAAEIPDADVWWMSPPCKPYTVRGNQHDVADNRAQSVLNLIKLIPQKLPPIIVLENVPGFEHSAVRNLLIEALGKADYSWKQYHVCSTEFGVPMKRPRYFLFAERGLSQSQPPDHLPEHKGALMSIYEFLDKDIDAQLYLDSTTVEKFCDVLNVIDPEDSAAIAICFTSGYWDCRKASGSVIKCTDGRIRRFSASEIVRLLGFGERFEFPEHTTAKAAIKMAGNSVDVRSIRYLLSNV